MAGPNRGRKLSDPGAKRGRRSAAALAIVQPGQVGAVVVVERPEPPAALDADQAEVWRRVVEELPADWFAPHNMPLLAQYCRHVVSANRVELMLRAALQPQPKAKKRQAQPSLFGAPEEPETETLDVAAYNALLIMQDRESRAIAMLATKMRIAQQSTIDKETKLAGVGRKPGNKPWQRDD